jgi:hypothetical protein
LNEAHAEIVKIREENRKMKERITKHLDVCEEALKNAKIMVKRYLPLHKQVKNLYKHNKVLRTKDILIKEQMEKIHVHFCFVKLYYGLGLSLKQFSTPSNEKKIFHNNSCYEIAQTKILQQNILVAPKSPVNI